MEGDVAVPESNQMNPRCQGCESNNRDNNDYVYRVQIGLFRNYENASNLQMQMVHMGCSTQIVKQGELYGVHVGEFQTLDEAVALEHLLRAYGFDTLLVAV